MERILVVFDLDGVLITSNFEKDKEHLFLKLNNSQDIPSGKRLFSNIKVLSKLLNESVYPIQIELCILTTRHPLLNLEIYNKFQVPVFTRDFCYTREEMKLNDSTPENTKIFLGKMVDFKIRYLNFFAERYDQVFFIDDMANLFDIEKLSNNIILFSSNDDLMKKLNEIGGIQAID